MSQVSEAIDFEDQDSPATDLDTSYFGTNFDPVIDQDDDAGRTISDEENVISTTDDVSDHDDTSPLVARPDINDQDDLETHPFVSNLSSDETSTLSDGAQNLDSPVDTSLIFSHSKFYQTHNDDFAVVRDIVTPPTLEDTRIFSLDKFGVSDGIDVVSIQDMLVNFDGLKPDNLVQEPNSESNDTDNISDELPLI
jgi:hypothetical protein